MAILSYDTDFHDRLPEVFPHAPQMRDGFVDRPQVRDGFASLNATLQAAYFMIAIRAAGLAAGPMGGFDGEALNAEFFPDGTQKVLMVVNIGRPGPDAWFGRLPRLGYEDVVTFL